MKKSFKISCSLIIAAMSLASCEQAIENDNTDDMEKLASNIKFQTIEEQLKDIEHKTTRSNVPTIGDGKLVTPVKPVDSTSPFSFVICSFDFGRNSRNCAGFGICDFEWFPHSAQINTTDTDSITSLKYNASVLKVDSDGNKFIDLLLAEPIDSGSMPIVPDLAIDEDLIGHNSKSNNSQIYIMQGGKYKYNPKLGNFGGYRISIK